MKASHKQMAYSASGGAAAGICCQHMAGKHRPHPHPGASQEQYKYGNHTIYTWGCTQCIRQAAFWLEGDYRPCACMGAHAPACGAGASRRLSQELACMALRPSRPLAPPPPHLAPAPRACSSSCCPSITRMPAKLPLEAGRKPQRPARGPGASPTDCRSCVRASGCCCAGAGCMLYPLEGGSRFRWLEIETVRRCARRRACMRMCRIASVLNVFYLGVIRRGLMAGAAYEPAGAGLRHVFIMCLGSSLTQASDASCPPNLTHEPS